MLQILFPSELIHYDLLDVLFQIIDNGTVQMGCEPLEHLLLHFRIRFFEKFLPESIYPVSEHPCTAVRIIHIDTARQHKNMICQLKCTPALPVINHAAHILLQYIQQFRDKAARLIIADKTISPEITIGNPVNLFHVSFYINLIRFSSDNTIKPYQQFFILRQNRCQIGLHNPCIRIFNKFFNSFYLPVISFSCASSNKQISIRVRFLLCQIISFRIFLPLVQYSRHMFTVPAVIGIRAGTIHFRNPAVIIQRNFHFIVLRTCHISPYHVSRYIQISYCTLDIIAIASIQNDFFKKIFPVLHQNSFLIYLL